jgi:cellulose synthase (UDP-forming)
VAVHRDFIVLLLGVATAAWRYAFEPGVTNVMLVVGLWALFNLLIAAAALGVVAERRELRRHPRLAVSRRSSVCFDGHTADATIVNVSAGGCAIRVAAADFIESPMNVDKSHGRLAILGADGHVVMRTLDVIRTRAERDGETVIIGLKFSLAPADYLVLADLIYGDADALMKFLTKRRKHMGILRGTMLFLRWSACEPFRAFYYLFAGYKQSMVARPGAAAPAAKSAMRIARPVALVSGPADPAVEEFAAPLVAAPSISPEAREIDPDVTINRRRSVVTPSMLSFDRANALYVPRT